MERLGPRLLAGLPLFCEEADVFLCGVACAREPDRQEREGSAPFCGLITRVREFFGSPFALPSFLLSPDWDWTHFW